MVSYVLKITSTIFHVRNDIPTFSIILLCRWYIKENSSNHTVVLFVLSTGFSLFKLTRSHELQRFHDLMGKAKMPWFLSSFPTRQGQDDNHIIARIYIVQNNLIQDCENMQLFFQPNKCSQGHNNRIHTSLAVPTTGTLIIHSPPEFGGVEQIETLVVRASFDSDSPGVRHDTPRSSPIFVLFTIVCP